MRNPPTLAIENTLKELGIKKGDTIFVHGDAGIAAQYSSLSTPDALELIFSSIIEYIGPLGTLIVPTFSYCATNGTAFDVLNTPSRVGVFSEFFRNYGGAKRSRHSIFSVAVIGHNEETFSKARTDDCFGAGTVFEALHKLEGKIVTLGFNMKKGVTFTHYVEQSVGVEYRFFKHFEAKVCVSDKNTYVESVKYYVRDTSFDSACDLTCLDKVAVECGLISSAEFGRFPANSIKTQDFFDLAEEMLRLEPYCLTRSFVKIGNYGKIERFFDC